MILKQKGDQNEKECWNFDSGDFHSRPSYSLPNLLLKEGMGWKGSGGWGMGTAYGKMYNPKTVETVSGEVISVDKITPIKGMSYGVHMTVKARQGNNISSYGAGMVY